MKLSSGIEEANNRQGIRHKKTAQYITYHAVLNISYNVFSESTVLFLEIAVEKTLETGTVTSLVLGHFMH